MKRMISTNAALAIVCLTASTVQAHEPGSSPRARPPPRCGDLNLWSRSAIYPGTAGRQVRRIAGLPDDRIFTVAETAGEAK